MPRTTAPVVGPGTMARSPQPRLHVDELELRPWTPDDVTALVAAYADADIQRWHTRTMTPEEAVQYVTAANLGWQKEDAANWAVTDGRDLLGRMSVGSIDLAAGLGSIGYWVIPASRGFGVAPRALVAVSIWAINRLGLHRLELEHSTKNRASCRVAAKAGYLLEGTKRSQALHLDGWHDMHLHVRLAEGLQGPELALQRPRSPAPSDGVRVRHF